MGTTQRAQSLLTRSGIFLVLAFFAVLAVYPIVFMALNSFRRSIEFIKHPLGFPSGFSYLDNYEAMFKRFDIPQLFLNTAICIAGASVLAFAVSLPASYSFAKLQFPFRSALRTMMIATLIVPAITFIVPSYVMMANWNLTDTYRAIILLWAATAVPSNTFLLSSLMRGIPNEVLEAARLDGASYLETMRRVVIPLSAPGIITIAIFNVTTWWNDLLIPLIFMQSDEKMTVTVGVATVVGRRSTDYPLLLTGLLFSSIPPILVYLVLQRSIRRGLVIGAVR